MRPEDKGKGRALRKRGLPGEPTNPVITVPAGTDNPCRCRRCGKPLRTDLAVKIGLGGKCASLAIAHVNSGRVTAAAEGQQTLPLDVEAVVS